MIKLHNLLRNTTSAVITDFILILNLKAITERLLIQPPSNLIIIKFPVFPARLFFHLISAHSRHQTYPFDVVLRSAKTQSHNLILLGFLWYNITQSTITK